MESLGVPFSHFRWTRHELVDSLRRARMETCHESLGIPEAHEKREFRRFVTSDESWFPLKCHHSTRWSSSPDEIPEKVKQRIGTAKFILTII
jgi:hypothetical protein